jgi:cell division protein FtsB
MLVIDVKRICSRLLFVGELVLFSWMYLFGAHGFNQLVHLKSECYEMVEQIAQKKQEMLKLQEQIIAWNVHSFCKEKMAREQLQMARKDEVIYLVS